MSEYAGRPSIRAALILLGILVVSFFPFVFGNKTLLESAQETPSIMPYGAWTAKAPLINVDRTRDAGAAGWAVEPLLQLTQQEYTSEKTAPVWNPYQAFGTPLAANMQSQTYYPLTVALSFTHSPRMRNWYLLLRLFAAGLCAYLYIRHFVSFVPALAAGVTSMFAGYYILYLSASHLSVEVLLPFALLSAEYILRSERFRSLACFSALVYLALTGGMPESSFLLLAFTYVYILFRLLSDVSFRGLFLRRAKTVFVASCFGFGFSAMLLFPFQQFMRYSFDVHQFLNTGIVTGLIADRPGTSVLTYLFPLLYGPGWDKDLRNYTGLMALFLVLVAVLCVRWRREGDERNWTALTLFFGSVILAILLKRYGVGFVNVIGSLPIFNLILYPKYDEPILSISISMLSAIGLERLVQWHVTPVKQMIAFGLTVSTIPAAVMLSTMPDQHNAEITRVWSIVVPTIALLILFLLLMDVNRRKKRGTENSRTGFKLSVVVLAILTCESVCGYFFAMYYVWTKLPTVASDPYQGAPFVHRLQELAGLNRIFAEDAVLYPNWASAFNLFDIRSLDAMYYRKYLSFVRAFFPRRPNQPGQDLYDRFTGEGEYRFEDPLEQRLLQMSSVKYVVTMPSTVLGRNAVDETQRQKTQSECRRRCAERPAPHGVFRLVYSHEVNIFEYERVLPRAAVYYSAVTESTEDEVRKKLVSPSLDVFETVLLNGAALDNAEAAWVANMGGSPGRRVEAARIRSYTSREVEVEASLGSRGILVLNDSDFPGWKVEVDGKSSKLITANYLFRGVLLEAGRHVVRFHYTPETLQAGAAISLASVFSFGVLGVFTVRKKNPSVN